MVMTRALTRTGTLTSTIFAFLCLSISVSISDGRIIEDVEELGVFEYDFVIAGGGTAGLVVANRLTEDPRISVLVVEAGGSDLGILNTQVPFFCTRATPNTQQDWNYTTVPQGSADGRVIPYNRGHVLGGSSTVNYMVYTRGSRDDYDGYARVTGDEGWSWDEMFKYFLKNEILTPPADHHDTSNQVNASIHGKFRLNGDSLPGFHFAVDDRVIGTTQELGDEFPFNLDQNSGYQLGLGWVPFTIRGGERSNSARAYIHPFVGRRSNLHVLLNTRVTRILPSSAGGSKEVRFRTVEVASNETAHRIRIHAKKEIVLSAGAFGTPQILLNSGVGDREALTALHIDTILHNPSVGANLSDHGLIPQSWLVNSNDTLEAVVRNETFATELLEEWNDTRTGELVLSIASQIGWFRLPGNSSVFERDGDPAAGNDSAHYELAFTNGFFGVPPPTGNFLTISSIIAAPVARGSVKLNTSNPFDAPLIDPNFLGADVDRFVAREALRASQRFVTAPIWSDYVIEQFNPPASDSDDDLDAYARGVVGPVWHASGTAAMSAKEASYGVVDPDLRLKGAKGVRVVDASVFPRIPTAHTQVPVYAFAERASDLIKKTWGIKSN